METAVVLTFFQLLLVSPSLGDNKKDHCGDTQSSGSVFDFVSDSIDFAGEAAQGAMDMGRAYMDMREANWKESDKYFHARGNADAASRGPGGKWAAEVISNAREFIQGADKPDSIEDQKANTWGREGGDPNKYRPEGLPDKY